MTCSCLEAFPFSSPHFMHWTHPERKKVTNAFEKCRNGLLYSLALQQYECLSRVNISPLISVHSPPTNPISDHYRPPLKVLTGAAWVQRPGARWDVTLKGSAQSFLVPPAEGCSVLCWTPRWVFFRVLKLHDKGWWLGFWFEHSKCNSNSFQVTQTPWFFYSYM